MITARNLLRAWQLCREASLDPFSKTSIEASEVPGWTAIGWGAADRGTPGLSTLEGIRALELQARETVPSSTVELVATLPGAGHNVQTTRDVVRSVVQDARRELLVVGYSITDMEFRQQIVLKGVLGVQVTLVSDRGSGHARELLRDWPAGATRLAAYEGVEPVNGSFLIHPKVIVADRTIALLGSANFTGGGLRNNLELGCLVQGEIAADLADIIQQLVNDGWLRPAVA